MKNVRSLARRPLPSEMWQGREMGSARPGRSRPGGAGATGRLPSLAPRPPGSAAGLTCEDRRARVPSILTSRSEWGCDPWVTWPHEVRGAELEGGRREVESEIQVLLALLQPALLCWHRGLRRHFGLRRTATLCCRDGGPRIVFE